MLQKTKMSPSPIPGFCPFMVYVEDNKLYVDVKLYGGPGKSPIEIVHNEFTIRPDDYDLNSNINAFEVVDVNQKPIFQLIYKRKSHITINGIFPYQQGIMIASDKGVVNNPADPNDYALKRIFKYPSWKYPGQLE